MTSLSSLLCLCLLVCTAASSLASRVLAVITPGCTSHLLGQRKLIVELTRRGHDVMVSALYISCLQQKARVITYQRAPAMQIPGSQEVVALCSL